MNSECTASGRLPISLPMATSDCYTRIAEAGRQYHVTVGGDVTYCQPCNVFSACIGSA